MSFEGYDFAGKISQTTGNGDPGDEVGYYISDAQSKQVRYFRRSRVWPRLPKSCHHRF